MSKTQSQLMAELEAIESLLNSGVTTVTVDGTTTQYDLEQLRKQASHLRSLIRSENAKRPVASSVYLGGF